RQVVEVAAEHLVAEVRAVHDARLSLAVAGEPEHVEDDAYVAPLVVDSYQGSYPPDQRSPREDMRKSDSNVRRRPLTLEGDNRDDLYKAALVRAYRAEGSGMTRRGEQRDEL